jgi:hypothetical protein
LSAEIGGPTITLAEQTVDRHSFLDMQTVFALALCLMASCTTVQPTSQTQLEGEWRYADKIQTCHYVFKRDGSFHGEVTYHRKLISKFTGRWSVQQNTLVYKYISDALDRIPIGAIDRDKLLLVQKDSFTIEAADGSRRRYDRIRQGEPL